jgi:hypothetical protein
VETFIVLGWPMPSHCIDEEESSTTMSETAPAAPATEAPAQQYMTKAHWDKILGYLNQLAVQHTALESKVEALTA